MSERRSRRPGRFRRWLVRPFFWTLTLLVLLAFAGILLLHSDWLTERAARLLESRASQLLERPVSVRELRFELLPLTVEIEGLVVGGRSPEEPPLAMVRRAVVDAWLYRRDGVRLQLRSVRLEEPEITLLFDEDGSSNLPRLGGQRPAGGAAAVEVSLDELIVRRGELVVEQRRLPLDLEAHALSARLWGSGEPQWQASAQDVQVTLPRARPYRGGVSVRGRLDGSAVELITGRFAGPDLRLRAAGRIHFGADRRGTLDVAAETSARLLEQLGYVSGQVAGDFDFGGSFFWDADGWGLQGALESPALRVLSFPLQRLRGVVTGDRERWQLEVQQAGYAGGALSGTLQLELAAAAEPEVALDLELQGLDLEAVLADQGLPVGGVSALVSGPFSYRFGWRRADRGTGWANLAVRRRDGPGLPFRGTVPLLIENGVFRTTAARLLSPAQRVEATGSYDLDRRRGRFRFRVVSDRIEQLLPLLRLDAAAGDALWKPTAGQGEIGGELALLPSGPAVELRLDLEQVSAPGASADAVRGWMAIDRAGIRDLRVELLRPEAGLIVAGSLPFEEPAAAAVPFDLTVDAAGWPLAESRAWLPFELPAEGPVYGGLRLGGSLESLLGEASLVVRPGTVLGIAVQEAEAELAFGAAGVTFERLRLTTPAGSLGVTGSWDRLSDELALQLESGQLDLEREPFAAWWAGELGGRLTVSGTVGGARAAPRLAGEVTASGLRLAGKDLGRDGEARLELLWQEGRITASGSLLGLVQLEGGGRLDDQMAELDLELATPDLRALAGLFGLLPEVEFAGAAAGRLLVAGSFAAADPWQTRLRLDSLELLHAGQRLRNLDPVELAWSPDALIIDSLYLGEEGTDNDLFVAGRVALGEPMALDLRVQSSLDTAVAGLLLPAFEFRGGRFDVLATVRGTPQEPRVNGQGEVRGARMVMGELPSLDRLQGAVLFYPGQVVLDSVRGELAGGRVLIGGSVDLAAGGRDLAYRLQLSGDDVTLRYPEGWELRGDAEVTIASVEDGRQVRGAVTLERALYLRRLQVGLTQLLQSLFQRRRQEVETTDETLASTQLNLLITGPGALRVRNNVANLRGDIDLALRGSLARPVLFGRVELAPGGTLQVGGSDYTVEHGFLTFANPYRMEPVIDLAATTRRRDYDLSLSLSGTLDRLNASLASDPPLADLDLLGLLATGEPTSSGQPALGAEALLYGQAASLVTDRVNRLFGLDRFRIDPLTGSSGSLSSARVTVGKQLSRDVLATYSYDPSQTEQQFLQLEWSVSRGLALVVTQNGDGTYAVDARWEKSF